jgi:EAL domain-containing protein (putative c-di-GMP-specific phosphodiesterase class I)
MQWRGRGRAIRSRSCQAGNGLVAEINPMVNDDPTSHQPQLVPFGRRRGPPRACVLDHKSHVRSFLAGMLEELGFATRDDAVSGLRRLLDEFAPDLIVFGPLNGRAEVGLLLQALRYAGYGGRTMLFGGRHSGELMEMQEVGERIGLAMLPPLGTPFRDSALTDNVACFLPIATSADMPVEAEEALRNGWLELWYQPKIDPRSLAPVGAEAIIRARHPNWGLISPPYFVPTANDPYFHELSQFVITQAMADSAAFAAACRPIDISVNLPGPALDDAEFVDRMLQAVPERAGKGGLQIELRCVDIADDLPRVRRIASRLAFRNVGISIDDIGREGLSIAGRHDLPVVEMKVSPRYVRGCAADRIKQAVCAEIIETARDSGARSVAVGVDTQADYLTVRELGFNLLQGRLFAKPMELRKFERTLGLSSTATIANAPAGRLLQPV